MQLRSKGPVSEEVKTKRREVRALKRKAKKQKKLESDSFAMQGH